MKKFISKVLIALTLSGVTFNNYSKAGWTGNPMTLKDIVNTWNHLWNDVFTKDDQLLKCNPYPLVKTHIYNSERYWNINGRVMPYSELVKCLKEFNVSSWVCLEFAIYLEDYLNQKGFLSASVYVRNPDGKYHVLVLSAYKDGKSGVMMPLIFDPYPAFCVYLNQLINNSQLKFLAGLSGINEDVIKQYFLISTPLEDLLNKYTTINLKNYLVYGSNRTLNDVLCAPKNVNEVVIIDSSINPNVLIPKDSPIVEMPKEKKGYFDFRDFMLEKFPNLKGKG